MAAILALDRKSPTSSRLAASSRPLARPTCSSVSSTIMSARRETARPCAAHRAVPHTFGARRSTSADRDPVPAYVADELEDVTDQDPELRSRSRTAPDSARPLEARIAESKLSIPMKRRPSFPSMAEISSRRGRRHLDVGLVVAETGCLEVESAKLFSARARFSISSAIGAGDGHEDAPRPESPRREPEAHAEAVGVHSSRAGSAVDGSRAGIPSPANALPHVQGWRVCATREGGDPATCRGRHLARREFPGRHYRWLVTPARL